MHKADVSAVLELERLSFANPYTPEILQEELKITVACLWVALHQSKIVGYVDFWQVADQWELVSVAVHPQYRGLGIGRALLNKMFSLAKRKKAKNIFLDVRVGNEAAKKLYASLGFKPVGLRKKYYSDNGEDALILRVDL